MTSILTNNSAMFALNTLRSINNDLASTNNRVSTGLRINSAADGAAYWSISSTLKSDNGALGAVKDAMSLDKNSVDAAAGGLGNVLASLDKIKSNLTAATSSNVDRVKLQTEIASYVSQIKTTADNTVMNGDNWLSTDSNVANFNASKGLVSSFSRTGSTVSVGTTALDTGAFMLYDKTGNAAGNTIVSTRAATTAIALAANVAGATVAVSGTATERLGFLDTKYVITSGAAVTQSIGEFDISALTDSANDVGRIQAYMKIVDATIQQLQNGATALGTTSTRISSQKDFAQKLIDINTSSIGSLVDADMEEESTKLKALQTQQQLGVQSLSIANAASQNVLSLFR